MPAEFLKVFETAVETIYRNDIYDEMNPDLPVSPRFQVQVYTDENPIMLRDLQSNLVGKIVCVPGIITQTQKTQIRGRFVVWECVNCGHRKKATVPFGFYGCQAPGICDRSRESGPEKSNCRLGSYQMNTDLTGFADQQIMKLQEAPELIPTGEMPRSMSLTTDRFLTDKCTPGNRVKIIGILSIMKRIVPNAQNSRGGGSIQKAYIRVLGIQSVINDGNAGSFMGFSMPNITEEDVESFIQMSRDPEIYEKIGKSIAPAIFGHPDIKKAIACLLFGGCPKKLPDGMRLRGDINVLLLGDPSVAKSQFLKFVDRVAPISVYTSGKGSSAAGLTASVIKDPSTGEF